MKKFFKNEMVMFIMLLFFFKPICFQYFSNLQSIENFFIIGKVTVAIIIILHTFFLMYPKTKVNKLLIKIFLFEIWIVCITTYFKGAIFRSIIDFVSTITIMVLIIKLFRYDKIKLLKIFKRVLFFCVVCQLISEILWPNGMPGDLYKNNEYNPLYFMTLDNGTTNLVCLCISLILLNIIEKANKKQKVVVEYMQIMICILTALFSGSTTALICSCLIVMFGILAKNKKLKIFEKSSMIFVIYLIITFIMFNENNIFSLFFAKVTGKIGFTGRNYLWSNAIELIKNSFFVGYGIKNKGYLSVWNGYYSSHNIILEILLQGGIIALILWISCLLNCFSSMKKIGNLVIKRILIASIFVILIALMMEATVHSVYLFSIMALINVFSEDKESINE